MWDILSFLCGNMTCVCTFGFVLVTVGEKADELFWFWETNAKVWHLLIRGILKLIPPVWRQVVDRVDQAACNCTSGLHKVDFSFHFLQALLLFAQVRLLLVASCPPSVACLFLDRTSSSSVFFLSLFIWPSCVILPPLCPSVYLHFLKIILLPPFSLPVTVASHILFLCVIHATLVSCLRHWSLALFHSVNRFWPSSS